MLVWRQVLVGLLRALPLVLVAVGEPFYQRRDHLDQDNYLSTSNENIVRDRTDAEYVLSKYGYLLCQGNRQKRESSSYFQGLRGLSEGSGVGCDERAVKTAIQTYQRTYNLPATGELDDQTKSLMSTSRCGNLDSERKAKRGTDQDAGIKSRASTADGEDNRTQLQHSRLSKRSTRGKSQLIHILSGEKSKARSQEYKKRHLEDYIAKIRSEAKGEKRILHRYTPAERKRRSVHVWARKGLPLGKYLGENGEIFNKKVVRWRVLTTGFSTRIPVEDQRATIDLAFRMWSEVIPMRFTEDNKGHINDIDIEIAFGKGSHVDCLHDFDGNGGEIAHSWSAGNMHFDDEENFKSIRSHTKDGIYLLRVAVHEIGHVLGLSHTNKSQSIMYAIYHSEILDPQFELTKDDRRDIQAIYGVCTGKFSTVFDWVRVRADNELIYNTYFFRENHYWMYDNHNNRTRYGDPLFIAREWDGVPDNPDGYVQFTPYFSYFFKGEYYYKYDSSKDHVVAGWPRKISEDFGPKAGLTESVPDHLDTVFYDLRDKNIYFFKDADVYVYKANAPEAERGCCVRKNKIVDEFPSEPGHKALPANLDAVYYSFRDQMMYFFKGEELWRNKLYDLRHTTIQNKIEYLGNWWNKWVDICDVIVT
ncbi:matrix metallopeptidase-21-like [Physella acuta]|uniref:matrix metallopeptidase-21-like n=1 Tax=Physella acuta TaxID=109671 RepID=UPI0027DE0306|nr:matrix metallopeptidase-21-like [Physella acuta]XP_059176616.1 matrix metallopeptidase-21-like [Physella acuta]XP_059176624.1 matrix metallopeptidase-21-like [Physella acuta]